MKAGAYSMILNVDGYTSVDGWLNVSDSVFLGGDVNYSITGSLVESGDALDATATIRPSAMNTQDVRHDVEDVALGGTGDAQAFALRGSVDGVVVELRCRRRGD